jgi:hypothetical protein
MASTSTGPTGSTSSTAQPPYTPKDLGENHKCLYCPDEPIFSSDEELKKHKDEVHSSEAQGKQTNTVPGISKESGYWYHILVIIITPFRIPPLSHNENQLLMDAL